MSSVAARIDGSPETFPEIYDVITGEQNWEEMVLQDWARVKGGRTRRTGTNARSGRKGADFIV